MVVPGSVDAQKEEAKERQRLYERTRDEILNATRSSSETYDKSLLTLSSAFLGGSLALIGQASAFAAAKNKWLIYGAWVCFGLTIILTVWSFVYGMFQYRRVRQSAERYYLRQDLSAWGQSDEAELGVLKYVAATGAVFVVGIMLLIAFVSTN